jgi:signal transduction histidine kinase
MTRPSRRSSQPARRKLLILGTGALFDHISDARLPGWELFLAGGLDDARRILRAHADLNVLLATAAVATGTLGPLKADWPSLRAILLTSDRALVRAARGLRLGDVARVLHEDAGAAELRAALHDLQPAQPTASYLTHPANGAPARVRDAEAEPGAEGIRLEQDWRSVVSHDLRTPLVINNSYAALLLSEPERLVPEVREVLERMRRNGQWMQALVDGILDLAAQDRGGVRLNAEPTRLGDLLAGTAERMLGLAQPRGVPIATGRVRDPKSYLLDRIRIEQVLDNLVSNAVKSCAAGRSVHLGARAARGKLTFEVRDEGQGMTPEECERAFHKFSSPAGGRGLGLAIAKAIVELHGGRIWVESRPGQGSTFRFTIVPATHSGAGAQVGRARRTRASQAK